MGLAKVKTLRTFEEGMVVYSALISEASTGKSIAMSMVRKRLVECEKLLEVSRENSKLVNGKIFFHFYFIIHVVFMVFLSCNC